MTMHQDEYRSLLRRTLIIAALCFPSGHAGRIFGFAGVWMIAIPESRVVTIVFAIPMLLSFVAMNYHFVSNVIAGSVLGGMVATYAAHLARLERLQF